MADLIVTVPSDTLILPESVIVPAARIPDLPAGGAVDSVNGQTGAVSLSAADVGAAPALGADDNYVSDAEKAALHTHPAVIAQGATQADARTAIGAGTSSFSGAYADLSGKPTLGDAAAKNTGTTAGTVAAGDDSRLSDARTPTSHTHPASEISDSTAAGQTILTAADAAAQRAALGLAAAVIVVDAGSNLSTARPSGAVMVIWQFDNGTVTGDQGENVVNGQDGDLFVVMPA